MLKAKLGFFFMREKLAPNTPEADASNMYFPSLLLTTDFAHPRDDCVAGFNVHFDRVRGRHCVA